MALFSKKQSSSDSEKEDRKKQMEERKTRLAPYEIHVMPQKFRVSETQPNKRGVVKWIIVAAAIAVFVLGASAAIYFTTRTDTTSLPVTTQQPSTNTPQTSQQPAASQPVEPVAPSTVTSEPTTTEPQTPATQPPSEATEYESTIDSDEDRLTNTEETLYQTETRVKDTDGDGFDDGTEVINGFSPKSAGLRLADSGLVNTYANPLFGYKVLHPASWLARATDQSLTEVIFQSTTGEFVRVSVVENTAEQSLLDWYLERVPQTNPAELRQKNTATGMTALVVPDGLSYFIADPENLGTIYQFAYEVGTRTKLNFLTTFEMMTNNFSL